MSSPKKYIDFTNDRQDVIKHFAINDPGTKAFGFNFNIDLKSEIKLFLVLANDEVGEQILLIERSNSIKVLNGYNGYLFLDNDTNYSVDQYTGKYNISQDVFNKWTNYFESARDASSIVNAKSLFLVVPAKEEIYPDMYPHRRGKDCFIDRFITNFGNNIIFLKDKLSNDREFTYYKTDTHWSDYGAYLGAVEVLRGFGLDHMIEKLCNSFNVVDTNGDLGGKFVPSKKAKYLSLSQKVSINFDNQISNIGRIWIFLNQHAEINETLIIFGDSFSNNFARYFKDVFSKVIFVHSVASFDIDIIEHEEPKYILFQTNQRFLINPPSRISIWDRVKTKINALDDGNKKNIVNRLSKFQNNIDVKYYVQKMIEILIDDN